MTTRTQTLLALVVAAAITPPAIGQESYESPEAAFAAVAKACAAGDKTVLATIIGGKADEFLEDETSKSLKAFADAYEVSNEVVPKGEKRLIRVGEIGYVHPLPAVAVDGKWKFDLESAWEELQIRRIGRNELAAIETLQAYSSAQRTYASVDRDGDEVLEFAQRIISSEGKRDGLFFETEEGESLSPFGPLVAEFLEERELGDPYYGYYYKILRSQGDAAPGGDYNYVINGNMIAGFAMLAWPADYGKSGIMSFIVSHQGKIYDCDLGEDTAKIAAARMAYQPDKGWTTVPVDGVDESGAE